MTVFKLKLDKKFRYGTYSVLTSVVVIAVLILLNVFVAQLNIKMDLSESKTYSLSDTSKETLDGLADPVTIYPLFKTGSENKTFVEMLDLYSSYSSNIKVIYKDPYIYPTFTSGYSTGQEISVNSIIVESGKRFKVIDPNELYNYNLNTNTGMYEVQSIDLEPKITGAIRFVAMDKVPKVYYVTGHDETQIPSMVAGKLDLANFSVENINTMDIEFIPEDCDVLFITTPFKDYSREEAEVISNYLANDGRAMVFIDYSAMEYPNLKSVINGYGIDFNNTVIIEGDPNYSFQNNPTGLLPRLEAHDINNNLIDKNYRVLLPIAQSLNIMELKKSTLTIEPLLVSSQEAYGKSNPDSQSINKEEGDIPGPLNVAVAVTDSYFTDSAHMTKIVVVGSAVMMTESIDARMGYTNSDFVINCADWLYEGAKTAYIPPKSLAVDRLMITTGDINMIALISCVVIPVLIFAAGFAIWFRRRNK